MKYITVTSSNDNSKILINTKYIVSIIETSDFGAKTIIHMVRDTYHITESKEEVISLIR